MDITYLGHSAFRLRGKDATIITDPYPPDIGFDMGKVSADIVTISHKSANHAFTAGVRSGSAATEPQPITGPGDYEVRGVLIAGVATSFEPKSGPTNTAYVFRFDDLSVCHLGDLRKELTDGQVEEIGSIDVLLLPVGGGGPLSPSAAAAVVSQLEPSIVVPMHYQIDGSRVHGLEPVDLFLREMGQKEWTPEPKLTVTRSSLPSSIRVTVLEKRG